MSSDFVEIGLKLYLISRELEVRVLHLDNFFIQLLILILVGGSVLLLVAAGNIGTYRS